MRSLATIGLLALACGGAPGESEAEARAPANVLIFLIDTLRADHLGCYGYDPPTSPELDAFARESVLFENAYAQASFTAPSHASLFTSTYASTHGVWNNLTLSDGQKVFPLLSNEALTLAEILAAHGYQTAGFADGGHLTVERGMAQGFEIWNSRLTGVENRVERSIEFLHNERDERPFFLFVHNYQVHTPYLPDEQHLAAFADPDYDGPLRAAWQKARRMGAGRRVGNWLSTIHRRFYKPLLPGPDEGPPSEADLAFLIALYDAELKLVDEEFARLVEALKAEGLYDDTLILVTSDHGEEFWDDGGFGHGHQLYDSNLHVPLIVRLPGAAHAGRRTGNVELLDVAPTLLSLSGLEVPETMRGRVLPLDQELKPDRFVFGETRTPVEQVSLRREREQAYFFPTEERVETRAAAQNFAQRARPILELWRTDCQELRAQIGAKPSVSGLEGLSPGMQAELEALGYTGD